MVLPGGLNAETKAEVYNVVADAAERVNDLSPEDLRDIVTACARMRVCLTRPLEQAIGEIVVRPHELSAHEVASICWALATLAWPRPTAVLHALGDRAADTLSNFELGELAQLGWAFAVFDAQHALFEPGSAYWEAVVSMRLQLRHEHETLLHQAVLWRREIGREPALPEDMRMRLGAAFRRTRAEVRWAGSTR